MDTDRATNPRRRTVIYCLPAIDPQGKTVAELEAGDMVEVEIQGKDGPGGLVRRYLAATKQKAVFPVESLEEQPDGTVMVKLDVSNELEGVMLPSADQPLRIAHQLAKRQHVFTPENALIAGIIAVSAVIVLLLGKLAAMW